MTAKKPASNVPAKVNPGGAVAEMPEFMKGAQRGVDNLGMEDVALPRIALMQGISPQVEQGLAKVGEFYHLLADKSLGSEIRLIPIFISPAFMLWRPRKSGGGLLARADDAKHWTPANASFQVKLDTGQDVTWTTKPTVEESGLDKWGSANPDDPQSQPAATRMLNMLAWLPDYPELSPSIFTFQRASLKAGRSFAGKLKMSVAPCYGTVFTMSSVTTGNTGARFQMPVLTGGGFVEDKALFDKLEEVNKKFSATGLRVSEAGLDNEGGGAEDRPAGKVRDDM